MLPFLKLYFISTFTNLSRSSALSRPTWYCNPMLITGAVVNRKKSLVQQPIRKELNRSLCKTEITGEIQSKYDIYQIASSNEEP